MEIYKFGGTSVGDAESIRRVFDIINHPAKKIIVLSANGKTTDLLARIIGHIDTGEEKKAESVLSELTGDLGDLIAHLFSSDKSRGEMFSALDNLSRRISSFFGKGLTVQTGNLLITQGELFSTLLFSHYLEESELEHELMYAPEIIFLDRNGHPDLICIRKNLDEFLNAHPDTGTIITQGFICSDHEGNIETLGRGGSDFTASLLGAAANADVIQIWSDVDGFLNNNLAQSIISYMTCVQWEK